MSKITSGPAPKELHALSVLEDNFKGQKADQAYSVKADGGQISLSQFYYGNRTIAKPTQVVAKIKGTRRTPGGRASNGVMQSAMGNLGDHERAVIGRDARKSYEGGHLISDKLLGDDSYVEDNFVPMHNDLNSPDFRNLERKAERGLIDQSTKAAQPNVAITMTVDVAYADDPFSVDLATLRANNVIPATFVKTDSGATSITFPRRVPARIQAKLEYDTGAHPNLCFAEENVGPESFNRLKGTAMDVDKLPLLDQASQEPTWGMDSAATDAGGATHTGGVFGFEMFSAVQPVPQPVAKQKRFTGGKGTVMRTIPLAVPATRFKKKIYLSHLEDDESTSYLAVEKAYGSGFAAKCRTAVKQRIRLCAQNGEPLDHEAMRKSFAKFTGANKTKAAELLKDPNVHD
jgi:hypothetical protein